jgi:hypothetical protein
MVCWLLDSLVVTDSKFRFPCFNVQKPTVIKGKRKMIDRIDSHPTAITEKFIERRSGKDRRKIFTMLDPDIDRRKTHRRKRTRKNRYMD